MAILEAPVLFETVIFKYICFPIFLIYLDDPEETVRRVKQREPQLSELDIRNRIKNQMNYKLKVEMSDESINNNRDIQQTYDDFILRLFSY